eukprot:960045-Pleurochrysis_carterae.AAC.1
MKPAGSPTPRAPPDGPAASPGFSLEQYVVASTVLTKEAHLAPCSSTLNRLAMFCRALGATIDCPHSCLSAVLYVHVLPFLSKAYGLWRLEVKQHPVILKSLPA